MTCSTPRAPSTAKGSTRAPGRVLVVDDQAPLRDVLCRRLERLGHEAVGVESGERALEWLAGTAADLVLLDVVMPGMNGLEVLARLKADVRLRDMPVLVVS